MGLVSQIWTLTRKNLLIALQRHTFTTIFRAFILPVGYIIFLAYSRNLFVPPEQFGIGNPAEIRSLTQGLADADKITAVNRLVFVNNGYAGGDIDKVIDHVIGTVPSNRPITLLSDPGALLDTCRSTLQGVTECYGAVIFASSPSEGDGQHWNYTLKANGALGRIVDVTNNHNDPEIFLLPLQRAVDYAIANVNTTIDSSALPSSVLEFSYTDLTQKEFEDYVRQFYQDTIINALAVTFLVGLVGVAYHLSGFIASERELGMSSLLEAMMPNKRRWEPQFARIFSYHLSFSIIYLPSWIIIGLVLGGGLFSTTNRAIVVIFHILAGLAITSWSIMGAVFFRKAQLSGIVVSMITLLLGIIGQVLGKHGSPGAIAVLSWLFAPFNYVAFIFIMARYERQKEATDLLHGAPNSWNIPGIVLWIAIIVQIVAYPTIAIFIERWQHGTGSKGRSVNRSLQSTIESDSEAVSSRGTVELKNFTKIYPLSRFELFRNRFRKEAKSTVVAVDNLTLTAAKGQILVLLGANGSGKSTTLDAIVGMNTVTSGTISVDGSGGLGICPQKNVLWPEVKVHEHIRIFNRLKSIGMKDSKESLQGLIKSIDMDRKVNAYSKTLSGGQKRKLQMGMMLTGGSTICCVDECTSGLDPLSRRKIWDILMSERGERTIIFTTHFLDEADILADHIAILSKGTLRAQGSSVALKDQLGGGYRVHLYTGPDHRKPPLIDLPGVTTEVSFDQTSYLIPSRAQVAQLVRTLEKEGIDDYQISGPTIEDVFLHLAEEVRTESETNLNQGAAEDGEEVGDGEKADASNRKTITSQSARLDLLPGQDIGLLRQGWVLMRKRFTLLGRNYFPYIGAFVLPIIAAGLVTNLVRNQTLPGCLPSEQVSVNLADNLANQYLGYGLVAGPSNRFPDTNSTSYFDQLFSAFPQSEIQVLDYVLNAQNKTPNLTVVDTTSQFRNTVSVNYKNVTPGGYFLGTGSEPPMIAYLGDRPDLYSGIFAQNVLNQMLINQTIITEYNTFDIPWSPNTGNSLQLVVYFGLVMAASPAFFALYPTTERLRHVRGLQYSNGVRALPLWLAYFIFDYFIELFSLSICVIIFSTLSSVWWNLGYLYLVIILFGMTSILLSYVVSLYARSQLSAFAIVAGGQAILFLVYLIGYLCTITYAPVNKVDDLLQVVHFSVSIVTPMGSLIRALFLSVNLFSTTCDGKRLAPYPGGLKQYGGPILYLIVQTILLFCFLLLHDGGSLLAKFKRAKSSTSSTKPSAQDEELADEIDRVNSSEDCLRLLHVSKNFGKINAVEDLTFGIPRGEMFALLGPNGAGKSTTISLIRGDIQPSATKHQPSHILVDSISVSKHRAQARSHLGVCPQFDAIDQLSVLETLRFYARVRGVSDIEYNVNAVLRAVGLQSFTQRMAADLSGGNKRKLSLAIALTGDPAVLLLDEPSSGMDAAAKRVMWRTLSNVVLGRSILLTTHSMEEAGALADKVGIMSKRMLAMGTTSDLRRKYGAVYHVHLVTSTAPHTTDEEMERIRGWVLRNFEGAVVERKTWHGQMRFVVPANIATRDTSAQKSEREPDDEISGGIDIVKTNSKGEGEGIGAILVMLDEHKEELGLEHFSVSPTTLDQVFLNIVEKHDVEEENYAKVEKRKWWERGAKRS